MTNIQKENKVKLMIGSLVAKANNLKLDSEILCVLVESKHKQKVFVELLVVDLLNKILNYSDRKYLDFESILEDQKKSDNLYVRAELYKLRQQGYVEFKYYKNNRYTVKATEKGMNHFITLRYKEMMDQGFKKDSIRHYVDNEGEMWFEGEMYG